MSFASSFLFECYFEKSFCLERMKSKSLKIDGKQLGLFFDFQVTQIFVHSESNPKKIHLFFHDDYKMCINNIRILFGGLEINTFVIDKEKPKKLHKQTKNFSVLESKKANGINEFILGYLQPNKKCKVSYHLVFSAQLMNPNLFYFKFPLNKSIQNNDDFKFLFQIKSLENENLLSIKSNFSNGKYNEEEKIYTICDINENHQSIVLSFETINPISSSMIVTNLQYNECLITIVPNLPPSINKNKEFVFLVDCSGSMKGNYIQKSSECLELLIKSLPSGSFFNIVKFGSSFEKLFANTKLLTNETMEEGIEFTKNIQSNLKSTNIYNALGDIVSCPNIHGQRQIFILSDGEVENAENVIELISQKANDNRIFTICIGQCYDSGFNEYLAESTCGKSVYIIEGDSINQKVIPLLQSSLNLPFSSIEFHVNSDNNIKYDIIPFSNSSINANGSFIFYLINYERSESNPFLNGITIKGKYGNENIEIPITETIKISNADGLCYGLNALIYYNYIKSYDLKANINNTEKANNVAYSKTFGILSKYTMYSISINRHIIKRKQTSSKKSENQDDHATISNAISSYQFSDDHQQENESQILNLKENIDESNLMKLMRCQSIEGYWEDLNEIKLIFGLKINEIQEIKCEDKDLEMKCVATIIVIATLHVKLSNVKYSWCLIEEKAINWLKNAIKNIDLNQILQKIEKQIINY